jgi:hypothetical protein
MLYTEPDRFGNGVSDGFFSVLRNAVSATLAVFLFINCRATPYTLGTREGLHTHSTNKNQGKSEHRSSLVGEF